MFERETKTGENIIKQLICLKIARSSHLVRQRFAHDFHWDIPIWNTQMRSWPFIAIIIFRAQDFLQILMTSYSFQIFIIKNIVRQCEVPISDVSLCLCLDMRLREQCYLNGGAHVESFVGYWGQNRIDKVVTLMKKHVKNWENTSVKVFFFAFVFRIVELLNV